MFCPECGYENPDGAKFCIDCRYEYPSTSTRKVAMWKCGTCGESVESDFEVCWNCQSPKPSKTETVYARVDNLQRPKSVSAASPQRRTAGRLAIFGIVIMIASAVAFLWGLNYTGDVANMTHAGVANLAGESDTTYSLARACQTLGAIGFFVGLVLFIVGIAQRATAA